MEGDFTDPAVAREATRNVDIVIHGAATVGKDFDDARRVNVEGTRTILQAARREGVARFAHISTLSVYALEGVQIVDEESPLKTNADQYGTTKAEGDRIVLEAMLAGFPATILRPGAILGAHPSSTWGVKIPQRVRDGTQKLVGDGESVMPFLHVENLVDAMLLVLGSARAVGRVYNVVDTHVSWRAFTDEIRNWFGTGPLPTVSPSEATGLNWKGRFSGDRIRSELGYAPRVSYEQGMKEAETFWRSQAL
jgi:nucleoside-diphosphate-sugar epimerase